MTAAPNPSRSARINNLARKIDRAKSFGQVRTAQSYEEERQVLIRREMGEPKPKKERKRLSLRGIAEFTDSESDGYGHGV